MSKIFFNNQNKIEPPILILQSKSNKNYGAIAHYTNCVYERAFNAPNNISFTVHKKKISDAHQENIWENLEDLKVIYIPEYKEKFEISVQKNVSNTKIKTVTGTALAEAELSQILLRDIEINTEIDITNKKYDVNFPTIFYRDVEDISNEEYVKIWNSNKKYTIYNENGTINQEQTVLLRKNILYSSSLLHRLLDKAPNYSIEHIDESLKNLNLIKSFSISNQYIYNELVGEISEEYGVLFQFDSINRTISAYDLYNTCYKCGHREDFLTECPKCGSKNFGGQYGENTSIFVSSDCLASELTKSGDPGSVKTYFKIEGGDELINAAISAINPTGNSYIFYLPDYMFNEMPQQMKDRINSYKNLKNKYEKNVNYLSEPGFSLSPDNVSNYNSIITNYLSIYYTEEKYPLLGSKPEGENKYDYNSLIGYESTTRLYYDLIDIESLLQTSLLPTPKMHKETISEAFELISKAFTDPTEKITVAVSDIKSVLHTSVDNAVIGLINTIINTSLFDVEVLSSNYVYDSNTNFAKWEGTIQLTNKETLEEEVPEKMEKSYVIEITDDIITFTKQKIQKNMARVDLDKIKDLTSLDERTYNGEPVVIDGQSYETWLDWFEHELNYYSVDNLERLQTEFLACQSVIAELKEEIDENNSLPGYEKPAIHFYNIYTIRLNKIKLALTRQNERLKNLYKIYEYDAENNLSLGELGVIRRKVNQLLNFQNYMENDNGKENYWKIFCSYLREDTYVNENYISTNLNNAQLIERTSNLISTAYKEIQKSAYNQYTINTTMNNPFSLKAFDPICDYFDVGNWMRVEIDGEVHKLRLLTFQMNYDELSKIDVSFSTVVHSPSYISDIKSIFNSVSDISSSYNSVIKQVDTTSEQLKDIAGKIENGIDSSSTKIVNDGYIEDIVINKNGILGRAYDDITKEYDPCQFKFIRNGLYMTNDNWNSIYNTLGKFKYDTGEKDNGQPIYKIAYGLKAETVVGDLIVGETLKIRNSLNNLSFDENGLMVENTLKTSYVCINPNSDKIFDVRSEKNGILQFNDGGLQVENITRDTCVEIKPDSTDIFKVSKGKNGTYDTKIIGVDITGNAYFKGTVYSDTGDIGGWIIKSTGIYSKSTSLAGEYITKIENTGKFESCSKTNDMARVTIYEGVVSVQSETESYCKIDGSIQLSESNTGPAKTKLTGDGYIQCENISSWRGDYLFFENPIKMGNTIYGNGYIELYNNTPYIDFHSGNSTSDFTSRIIDEGYHLIFNSGSFSFNNKVRIDTIVPYNSDTINLNALLKADPLKNNVLGGQAVALGISQHGNLGVMPSSSKRYKHNINIISEKSLNPEKLLDINVVQYQYNEDYIGNKADSENLVPGFIAEEIAEKYPVAAIYMNDQVEDWNYRYIIPPMLKLIQDLYKKIENIV